MPRGVRELTFAQLRKSHAAFDAYVELRTALATYGALPPAQAAASPNLVTFQFNSTNGDTLNSTVTDSNYQTYFVITTVPGSVKVTTFATADGVPFATVEWSTPPLVTIMNKVPRQDATKWLLFSRDRG